MLGFAPQCCDAFDYLTLGEQYATHEVGIWNNARPIGAQVYFSIPFRLGVPPELIVAQNLALMALSVTFVFLVLRRGTGSPAGRVAVAACWLASGLAHVLFMLAPARNALTDVPAASLGLSGLSVAVLGVSTGRPWLVVLAAPFLSGALLMRAFYLYPALLAGAALVGLCLRRRQWLAGACLAVLLAAPVLTQMWLTHRMTGAWSFVAPSEAARVRRYFLSSPAMGYDTLVPPVGHPYPARPPAPPDGLLGARQRGEVIPAGWLLAQRVYFYLGSYTAFNAVYLTSAADRIFSPWIAAANLLALGTGTIVLARLPRAAGLAPALFLLVAWAEALLLQPEARFIMAIHVLGWAFALAGAAFAVAGRGVSVAERLRRSAR
jgi:hypothetical protein